MNCSQIANAKVSGFTLVELLVTVILIGIMAAFAAPFVSDFVARQKVESGARNMLNLFSFARNEAVRLNQPVYVCPLTVNSSTLETTGCKALPAGANQRLDWKTGALAFADISTAAAATDQSYDTGEAIRRVLIDSKDVYIEGQIFTNGAGQPSRNSDIKDIKQLVFSSEGVYDKGFRYAKFIVALAEKSNEVSSGTITSAGPKICSVVILESSGRARLCQNTNKSDECKCKF